MSNKILDMLYGKTKATKKDTSSVNSSNYDPYTGFSNVPSNVDPYQTTISRLYNQPKATDSSNPMLNIINGDVSSKKDVYDLIHQDSTSQLENVPIDANFYTNKDIASTTEKLKKAGIDVPASKFEKPTKKKVPLWLKALNFLSMPGYQVSEAVKNAVDDDKSTTVLGGLLGGIDAGLSKKQGTSGSDIIDTLAKSKNPIKQANSNLLKVINPIYDVGYGVNKLTGWKGMQDFGEGSSGFILDLLLDPTTYLTAGGSSFLKGTKVAKGGALAYEDALKVTKELEKTAQTVDKSYNAETAAQRLVNQVNRYNKIAMPGQGGIRYMGKELMSDAKLRELSDKLGISKATSVVSNPIKKQIENNPNGVLSNLANVGNSIKGLVTDVDMEKLAHSDPTMAARKIELKNLDKKAQYYIKKLGSQSIEDGAKKLNDLIDMKDHEEFLNEIEKVQAGTEKVESETELTKLMTDGKAKLEKDLADAQEEFNKLHRQNMVDNPKYLETQNDIKNITSMLEAIDKLPSDLSTIKPNIDAVDMASGVDTEQLRKQYEEATQNLFQDKQGKAYQLLHNVNGKDYVDINNKNIDDLGEHYFKQDGKLGRKAWEETVRYLQKQKNQPTLDDVFHVYDKIKYGYQKAYQLYPDVNRVNAMQGGELLGKAMEFDPKTADRFRVQKDLESAVSKGMNRNSKNKNTILKTYKTINGKEVSQDTQIYKDLKSHLRDFERELWQNTDLSKAERQQLWNQKYDELSAKLLSTPYKDGAEKFQFKDLFPTTEKSLGDASNQVKQVNKPNYANPNEFGYNAKGELYQKGLEFQPNDRQYAELITKLLKDKGQGTGKLFDVSKLTRNDLNTKLADLLGYKDNAINRVETNLKNIFESNGIIKPSKGFKPADVFPVIEQKAEQKVPQAENWFETYQKEQADKLAHRDSEYATNVVNIPDEHIVIDRNWKTDNLPTFPSVINKAIGKQGKKTIQDLLDKAGLNTQYNLDTMDINQGNYKDWKKALTDIIDNNPEKKTIQVDSKGINIPKIVEESVGKANMNTWVSDMKISNPTAYQSLLNEIHNGTLDTSKIKVPADLKKSVTERLNTLQEYVKTVDPKIHEHNMPEYNVAEEIAHIQSQIDSFEDNYRIILNQIYGEKEVTEKLDRLLTRKETLESKVAQMPEKFQEAARYWFELMDKFGEEEVDAGLLPEKSLRQGGYVPHILSRDTNAIQGESPEYQSIAAKYLNDKIGENPHNPYDIRKNQMSIKDFNTMVDKETDGKVKNFFETDAVRILLKRGYDHNRMMYEKTFNDLLLNTFGVKMEMRNIDGKLFPGLVDMSPELTSDELANFHQEYTRLNNTLWNSMNKKALHISPSMIESLERQLEALGEKMRDVRISDETVSKLFNGSSEDKRFAHFYNTAHKPQYSGGYQSQYIPKKVSDYMKTTKQANTNLPKIARQIVDNTPVRSQHTEFMNKIKSGEYVLVYPEGMTKDVNVNGVVSDNGFVDAASRGIENVQAEKSIQRLIQVDLDQITSLPVQSTDMPMYALPKPVYEMVKDVVGKQLKQDQNALVGFIDKFTNLWKANATLSIGFHTRNTMSNTFQNFLNVGTEAISLGNHKSAIEILRGKAGQLELGGKNYTYDDIRRFLGESGLIEHNQFNEEFRQIVKGDVKSIDEATNLIRHKKDLNKFNPLSLNFAPYVFSSKKVGSAVENEAKIVNFIANLKTGMTPEEASDMTQHFLFDYSDLTNFEKSFMKRAVPFYTWMRKNIPLQLEMLMENQMPFKVAEKAKNNFSKPIDEEDKQFLPDFTDGYVNLGKSVDKDGNETYNLLDPNLPYQDLGKLTDSKDLLSGINPLAKMIIEQATNHDIYFGTPLEHTGGELKQTLSFMPTSLAEALGGGKSSTTGQELVPGRIQNVIKNLFPSLGTADKYKKAGQEASLDNLTPITKILGAKSYDFDLTKTKNKALRDYLDQLIALQYKEKMLGTDFSYQPKEDGSVEQTNPVLNIINGKSKYNKTIYK